MRYFLLFLFFAAGLSAAEHPHLLFSKEDVPALQAKIKAGGIPGKAYKQLIARCNKHLQMKSVPSKIVKSQLSDAKLDALSELALAWQLGGDMKYLNAVERLVTDARNRKIDLIKTGHHVPYILDWAYVGLSLANQKYLKDLILKELKTNPKMNRHPAFSIFGNWGYFMYMPHSIRYRAVLSGHPEFDKAGLDKAALAMKTQLKYAIVPGGAVTEHGAYFNYPMVINGSAILMLERKGYSMVKDSNFPKLPEWLLLETAPMLPLRFIPMEDCNVQDPEEYVLRLIKRLVPESKAIDQLLIWANAEQEPAPDPISGIIYHKAPEKVTPEKFALSRFFPEMNLLLYRSDWSEKALHFASEAIVSRGHSHSDVGSFVLHYGGVMRTTDPGYGHKSGLLHNIVTINGKAPSEHGGAGLVNGLVIGKFAVLYTVDAFDAWNRKVGYSSRMIEKPEVSKAERTFAVMPPDVKNQVPGYVIVTDSIRSLLPNATYEFRLQQEPFNNIRTAKDTAEIAVGAGAAVDFKKKSLKLNVSSAGTYDLYMLGAGKSQLFTKVNGKDVGKFWFSTPLPYRLTWNCIAKKVPLKGGENIVELNAAQTLKGAWIYAGNKRPIFGVPAENSVGFTAKAVKTTVWYPLPENVSLKVADVKCGKEFQHVRTVIAEGRTGDFLTVILPDAVQPIRKSLGNWYGFSHSLEWKNAVDFIAVGTAPKSVAAPLQPQLKMMRVPKKAVGKIPGTLPDELQYFIAGGGDLKLHTKVVFEAKEAQGDRQMITYPRVAIQSWVVCDGETLTMDLRLERRSNAYSRKISVKAFAPKAKAVYCNGRSVEFRKEGKYIVFTVMPEEPRVPGTWHKKAQTGFTEEFYRETGK
ncbi:MAG: hypothetical protein IJW23_11140 [Lentisphaeria bacterium]|nr:hypothetical protein [Lentisphaeria bacterium]